MRRISKIRVTAMRAKYGYRHFIHIHLIFTFTLFNESKFSARIKKASIALLLPVTMGNADFDIIFIIYWYGHGEASHYIDDMIIYG